MYERLFREMTSEFEKANIDPLSGLDDQTFKTDAWKDIFEDIFDRQKLIRSHCLLE